MTAVRIQMAAFERFAKQGFASTSMNEIAQDVGIKKPSIYAHFKSKDSLYLSLIPIMINKEIDYARTQLIGGHEIRQQLYNYFSNIEKRFEESYDVKFWMNALMSPPIHLYDEVIDPMHKFMDDLENIFKSSIENSILANNLNALDSVNLARICMSFVDSLQSELIYGGSRKYHLRLHAILLAIKTLTAH